MRDTSFGSVFAVLGYGYQVLLLADFSARLWRPELELRWGWVLYTLMAVGGLAVGIGFVARGAPVNLVIAPFLLALGAGFGLVVDTWLRIPWRQPPMLQVFIPYIVLYTVSLFGFLFPLWEMGWRLGLPYTVLFVVHTVLNASSHFVGAEG